ncbi:hypothetical protein OTERR_12330 [Oryzomicrobium terrae]|uniref:Uncharacterized protein n=1 Tax=Oryzomicrobium terrae TaxID=1735038 RepID=A0A5C1E7Y4_9RHOO|nr:hypothetical protein [Oryzomicrobium terrae]QEL64709.1 hypothetical protein OTERR_12330 [Oryzomicrobium terrae]
MMAAACSAKGMLGEGCEECVDNYLTRVGASRIGLETGRAFHCIVHELDEIEREASRFYRRTGWMALWVVAGVLSVGLLGATGNL